MAAHAVDLRTWTRAYSFIDSGGILIDGSAIRGAFAIADEAGGRHLSLHLLRSQLQRARQARVSERAISRDYAVPLFVAAVDSGQVAEALHVWREDLRDGAALAEIPEGSRSDALVRRSVLAQQMGDTAEAMRYASIAIEAASHLSMTLRTWHECNALFQFAQCAIQSGELDDAEDALRQALNAAQQLPEGIERAELLIGVETNLGTVHGRLRNVGKAIEYYECARGKLERLRKSTSDRVVIAILADTMANLAVAYRLQGDIAAA